MPDPRRRIRWVPSASLLVVLLAGCGGAASGTGAVAPGTGGSPVRSLAAKAPDPFTELVWTGAKVALEVPRGWRVQRGSGTLLAAISSGQAVIALWRFFRPGPPPANVTQLRAARALLIGAIRDRDPGVRVLDSVLLSVGGAGAVELDAVELINGVRQRVRSVHVYRQAFELVLEEYAPPALFASLDNAVFTPVRSSLRLL